MALSMADKLRQAAASRMAQTSGTTTARLDDMDIKVALKRVPTKKPQTSPLSVESDQDARDAAPAIHSEASAPYGAPGNDPTPPPEIPLVHPPSTTKRYNQEVQPDSTTEKHNYLVQQHTPNGTTTQYIRLNQKAQPNGITKRYNQEVQPTSENSSVPNLVKTKARSLTPQQQRVMDHISAQGPHITDKTILSEKLGIAPFTVRNILIRLTQLGLIERKRIGQGMFLQAISKTSDEAISTTKMLYQEVVPLGCTKKYNQDSSLKIDRKSLSISLGTLQTSWPTLARAGFGLEQIEQIHAALAQLGKSLDRIVQGLDHAEWELAEGKMLDKQGQPVADPCAWVYRSLASQGYYRRPAGYVSAEEQAERDAIEEAKSLTRTRENARQERFRAWLQSLSGDEKENVLAGRIGPEEAWLKKEWAKRGEPH